MSMFHCWGVGSAESRKRWNHSRSARFFLVQNDKRYSKHNESPQWLISQQYWNLLQSPSCRLVISATAAYPSFDDLLPPGNRFSSIFCNPHKEIRAIQLSPSLFDRGSQNYESAQVWHPLMGNYLRGTQDPMWIDIPEFDMGYLTNKGADVCGRGFGLLAAQQTCAKKSTFLQVSK
jgi:hypothetical protein